MTEAIFDRDAISGRLAQMRGDAGNGTVYHNSVLSRHQPQYRVNSALDVAGSVDLLDHVFSIKDGHCGACGYSEFELQDGLAPRACPGTKLIGEACIGCGAKSFVVLSTPGPRSASKMRLGRCLSCRRSTLTDVTDPRSGSGYRHERDPIVRLIAMAIPAIRDAIREDMQHGVRMPFDYLVPRKLPAVRTKDAAFIAAILSR